jgi:hypothetical protein
MALVLRCLSDFLQGLRPGMRQRRSFACGPNGILCDPTGRIEIGVFKTARRTIYFAVSLNADAALAEYNRWTALD